MRSRLAAAALALLSVAVLVTSQSGRAGDRMPTMSVPVKKALENMKLQKAPPGAIAEVRFYAEVLDGKSVEFVMGDFSNSGMVSDQIVETLSKIACAKPNEAQLAAASALLTEYGEALPREDRGFILGHQGKGDQAAPLLMQALESSQPLDRCTYGHPDDAGAHSARTSVLALCFEKLVPKPSKADKTKLEAIRKKSMECVANTFGTVG